MFDADMNSTAFEKNGLYCFDPSVLDSSTAPDSNGDFEELFLQPNNAARKSESASSLSPKAQNMDATLKNKSAPSGDRSSYPSDTQSDSPADSSLASSGDSPASHLRHTSINSNTSEIFSPGSVGTNQFLSNGWPGSEHFSAPHQTLFGQSPSESSFAKTNFTMEGDIERSNKVMDSAFDFDSAASSPSPLKTDLRSASTSKSPAPQPPILSNAAPPKIKATSPQPFGFPTSPYMFQGAPVASPSAFAPEQDHPPSYWEGFTPPPTEHQDSYGGTKEDNRSSLNSTLSPSLDFGLQPHDAFNATQYPGASFPVDGQIATNVYPNRDVGNQQRPMLVVHPTSLKSRVETQIPIKLTLYSMPLGVKKLRLPSHAISKPKFLAKPDVERSSEILELNVNVVCTSAMQDSGKLERAFASARDKGSKAKMSDGASGDEETPLDGAEVKICSGCIQRERKRASRKKQRKPEEDELFQKDEDKRIVVFNTTELKDWAETPKPAVSSPSAPQPPNAMQVEFPMRIACYCRHQNEKQGFQVIFTIRDHLDNVLAQAITNSIMITDDHKTHPSAQAAAAASAGSGISDPKRASTGVFAARGKADMFMNQPPFKLSHSATDLQALRNQQFTMRPNQPVPDHNRSASTTASSTPKNLSRHASPVDASGPSAKRRKQSGSGKVPTNLAMTKIETPRQSVSASNSSPATSSSSLPQNLRSTTGHPDLPYVTPSSLSPQFANVPPTPNTNDAGYFGQPERVPDGNAAFQPLMSAPSSAHPSRPGTPNGGNRAPFVDQNAAANAAAGISNQSWAVPPSIPTRLPTMIHKLVPAEGSTTGGNEVTILGSGFAPGMEVVFGDTLATTTTFWGDKCLNCLTPPALQPGTVPVVFKHEHPRFGQTQPPPMVPKQQILYRYVDDRELQMYRVALNILGQKLRNPGDAFQTAQQIMGGDPSSMWNINYQSGGQTQHGGGNSQNTSQNSNLNDLDARMLVYLEFMDLDDSPRTPRFNSRSSAGQTLLHLASSLGLTRFVAGLLARRADPNIPDNNGNTPMHLAALSGHNHIVHRLRLSGANVRAENARAFTPADLATTLPAHQAVLVPSRHYRARSVDSTRSLRRRPSSSSLDLFWETSSSDGLVESSSPDEDDEDEEPPASFYSFSRRASFDQGGQPALYATLSREGSVSHPGVASSSEGPAVTDVEVDRSFSPPAALVAWRDQLAGQINQFQQNVNRAFPTLPALPPMPALPDYQAYPMVRRISSLVPQRPTTAWSTSIMKDGWDRLTGNAPPAYEELYPINESDEHQDIKKSSVLQAAADAALDEHFDETAEALASGSEAAKEEIGDVRIGRKNITPQQQEQLRKAHARKMKKIRSDRNLFFIWIPLLVVIIVAMFRNFIPDIWRGVSRGYEFVKNARYLKQEETCPAA